MALSTLHEALNDIERRAELTGRGSVSLALVITNQARQQDFPLEIGKFLTPSEVRVRGLSGSRVRTILSSHGIHQNFTTEAGRTSPRSVPKARAYIDWLNQRYTVGDLDLIEIEAYWANKALGLIRADVTERVPDLPEQKAAPAQYEWVRESLRAKEPGSVVAASAEDFAEFLGPLRRELSGLEKEYRGSNQHRALFEAIRYFNRQLEGDAREVFKRDFEIGYSGLRFSEIVLSYEKSVGDEYSIDPGSFGRLKAISTYYGLLERRLPRWMEFKIEQEDLSGLVEEENEAATADLVLGEIEAELRNHPDIIDNSTPESIHGVRGHIQLAGNTTRAALRAALTTIGNFAAAIATPIFAWAKKQASDTVSNIVTAVFSAGLLTFLLPRLGLLINSYPDALAWLKPVLAFLEKLLN